MRSDLESAMAAVITSRSENTRFIENPEKFAKTFSLEPAELASLIEMGPDLTSLTGSFVGKRSGTLRWNAHRTLDLLGPPGATLLAEFVDTHPMTEWFRDEARMFSEFMVERTAALQDNTPRSQMISEMARFEKHRSDAFWDAVSPEDRTQRPEPVDPRHPGQHPGDRQPAVVLRAGANIGQFGWDMRLPYRRQIEPLQLLRPDSCQLLFFHNGTPNGTRMVRLRPDEVAVVQAMSPGSPVPLASLEEVLPDGGKVADLIGRFLWQEVVQWA